MPDDILRRRLPRPRGGIPTADREPVAAAISGLILARCLAAAWWFFSRLTEASRRPAGHGSPASAATMSRRGRRAKAARAWAES